MTDQIAGLKSCTQLSDLVYHFENLYLQINGIHSKTTRMELIQCKSVTQNLTDIFEA